MAKTKKMKKWEFNNPKTSIIKAYQTEKKAGNYDEIAKKYKDPATRYAFDVLDEKILTCRPIKLDAFRHLQDLRRSLDKNNKFNYHYDLTKCREILWFASMCPNPDKGEPMPLALWQQAILCKIVGWVDQYDQPRFSDIVISVARTNGKTYLSEILMSYYFLLDIDTGGQGNKRKSNQDLAYVATTTTQTDKGWRYIMSTFNILAKTPGFKKFLKARGVHVVSDKVDDNNKNIIMKLSQQSGVFDGYHFRFCVTDEAGSNEQGLLQKIRDDKDKITSGFTQTAGQIVQISTAYPDSNSYLYTEEQAVIKAMENDYIRTYDDHLLMLWTQDDIKEAGNPDTWIKSNPLLGLNKEKYASMMDNLKKRHETAEAEGTLEDFENKALNIWLQAKVNSYLELDDIEAARVKEPPIDIDGRTCYIGLDLSYASDDTALVFLFPYTDQATQRNEYYVLEHSWIPLNRSQGSLTVKSKRDGINYANAKRQGYASIDVDQRGFINQESIFRWTLKFVQDHNLHIKFFCYDPWHLNELIGRFLQIQDWPALEVRQNAGDLTSPTMFLRKVVGERQIKFDYRDPILPYSLKNAILKVTNGGIRIDKDKQTAKIDVVDALIDTMYRGQYAFSRVDPLEKPDKANPFKGWSGDEQNDLLSKLNEINGFNDD